VLIPQAVPYGVKVPVPIPVKVEIPKYKEIEIKKNVYVKVPIYEHIPIYHHFAISRSVKKPPMSPKPPKHIAVKHTTTFLKANTNNSLMNDEDCKELNKQLDNYMQKNNLRHR